MKNLAFLTQMKDDYTTNSHYPIYFSSKVWENVLFELGSDRAKKKFKFQIRPSVEAYDSRHPFSDLK